MLRLPTVYGETGGEAVIELVADGNLRGRGEELEEVCVAKVVGNAALELDIRERSEILCLRRKGECGQKGQNNGKSFHISVIVRVILPQI